MDRVIILVGASVFDLDKVCVNLVLFTHEDGSESIEKVRVLLCSQAHGMSCSVISILERLDDVRERALGRYVQRSCLFRDGLAYEAMVDDCCGDGPLTDTWTG